MDKCCDPSFHVSILSSLKDKIKKGYARINALLTVGGVEDSKGEDLTEAFTEGSSPFDAEPPCPSMFRATLMTPPFESLALLLLVASTLGISELSGSTIEIGSVFLFETPVKAASKSSTGVNRTPGCDLIDDTGASVSSWRFITDVTPSFPSWTMFPDWSIVCKVSEMSFFSGVKIVVAVAVTVVVAWVGDVAVIAGPAGDIALTRRGAGASDSSFTCVGYSDAGFAGDWGEVGTDTGVTPGD
jgi:hypothetical protein